MCIRDRHAEPGGQRLRRLAGAGVGGPRAPLGHAVPAARGWAFAAAGPRLAEERREPAARLVPPVGARRGPPLRGLQLLPSNSCSSFSVLAPERRLMNLLASWLSRIVFA